MDRPRLDVRLAGLEERSPAAVILTSSSRPSTAGRDIAVIESPEQISKLDRVDHLFVEGGAATASSFLSADLVDRLLLYRAPILIGSGKPALGDIGLAALADAHGRWRLLDSRMLGIDRLEVYERVRD
jgi:diaminohydroxyphosphoribosylaminopyrimidine deaminase/5-amino-6-(5-phosphoribosylamino)uracil reductase